MAYCLEWTGRDPGALSMSLQGQESEAAAVVYVRQRSGSDERDPSGVFCCIAPSLLVACPSRLAAALPYQGFPGALESP